jgi:hypothetical protein
MHGRVAGQDLALGPDFLCIGMGKAGTGWLYDQLSHHADFWMPPIKELHYLDRDRPRMIMAPAMLDRLLRRRENAGAPAWEPEEKKEFLFLKDACEARSSLMDLEFYASLFRFKGELMSGDISPSYCSMPEDLIGQIMTRFPNVKVILMMRDPVARAWSHFQMKNRGEKVATERLLDPEKFARVLDASKTFRKGAPAAITKKWLRHVPPAQYRHYFFDDLQADPASLRRQILAFLGADPAKGTLDPGHNRKADKPKLAITPQIEAMLAQRFADELRASAEIFGGHAAKWAAKYGV